MNVEFPKALRMLFEPARYKVLHGGRGSGKSWGVARALLLQAAQQKLRVLCTREIQKSLKDSVHTLLKDQIQEMGLSSFYEVLETEIRGINGSSFLFAGLQQHTVESIKSFEGCDRVWVEEAQTVSGKSWDVLIPTIRKPGSEIWITLNPQLETDPTFQRFIAVPPPGAVVKEMNYTENPWFPAVLETERQHAQQTMKPEKYRHIWEGKCMPAVDGAIYFDEIAKAEDEGRITLVKPDKLLKVHAIFDLGWNDCMTIVMVQRSASELRVVDYIEDSHKKLSDYSDMLKAKPYTWGKVWLPHDGFAKDYKTGKSADEMMRALGWTVARVPNMDIEGGIKAAREIFERVWFDKDKAARLVECLKRYRRNIGQKTGEGGTPLHDEFSHGADAFRYMTLVADQLTNTERKRPNLTSDAPSDWMGA